MLLGELQELVRAFQRQPHRVLLPATSHCRMACAFVSLVEGHSQKRKHSRAMLVFACLGCGLTVMIDVHYV